MFFLLLVTKMDTIKSKSHYDRTRTSHANRDCLEGIPRGSMKNFYELDLLIPLILSRGISHGLKKGMGRFQITKIISSIFTNSGIYSIQKSVFIYKYGPYILKFEDALADLVRRNIMEVITDDEGQTRFCITEDGQRWVMARLRDQYKNTAAPVKEIDRCIFTPISELIIEIAEKSPLLNPTRRVIGNKELIRVFDWKNFGDGKIHGYHYTLLRSFYRLEDYFDDKRNKADKKIEEGNADYQFRIVDYSAIPKAMYSEDLKNTKENRTIRYIFNKQDPKSIAEDKFEGKNYIGHLWYIYSAINIIHVLAGLAPTIDEIARMCLTQYEYAIKGDTPYSQRRRMREGAIRSDMQKLVKYATLNKRKVDKLYIYSIRAKEIIDNFTSNTYSLLNAKKIMSLYGEEIRPLPDNIEIIKQIRSNETKIATGG